MIRKLKKYKPTTFMAKDSVYDKTAADYAVAFIEALSHTKGTWAGKPFELIDWQEQIVRDVFGILKPDGYRQFNTSMVEIPKKQGKELSLDTLIPTPDGYKTMGDIEVGDTVFSETGQPCKVVAKSDVDYHEAAYRITFRDGQVVEAGEQHQWAGELTYGKNKTCVMTTGELYRLPKDGTSIRFRIAVSEAVEMPEAGLPIEPYLMGYWLGNGTASAPCITIRTEDIAAVLKQIIPFHAVTTVWHNSGDSKRFGVPALRNVLLDSYHDKVIPIAYLRSSIGQRFRLLQGLMDSDGSISKRKGQGIYCSTEKALAESVSELLWSLGIKNAITEMPSTQRLDWTKKSVDCGRVHTGETLYYVKFTAFDDLPVSALYRKRKHRVPRKQNPAEENSFRQLRLNQWVKQAVRWMPMAKWDACAFPVIANELDGRVCYGGLDLSSTTDITAFVLVFPPVDDTDKYQVLPFFWMPEENISLRVRRDHVQYDLWEMQGYMMTTDGNVVHYGFIETFIENLGKRYNIREIAFDRWGAVQMVQNLEGLGFTVVPFGQGFKDMSPPTKELMKLTLEGKIAHGGHPVLRWMMDNIFIKTDPAGNVKPDKEKSTERIDGAVATIMALDRAIRCGNDNQESVYSERGLLIL